MSVGQAITVGIPVLQPGQPALIPILAQQLAGDTDTPELPVPIGCTVDLDVDAEKTKKKQRPCKGQRMRSIRFEAMLKKKISENPEGFDFENVELIPSISTNEERRMKFKQKMKDFQLQANISKQQKSGISSCSLESQCSDWDTQYMEWNVIDQGQIISL